MRQSRTADEDNGNDESLLSEGTLTENAGRGPRARAGGHGDEYRNEEYNLAKRRMN